MLARLFILWFTDNFISVAVRIGQVVPVTNGPPNPPPSPQLSATAVL